MVPSVRTTSRRHDDARVLRQDDDEDDEKRNAGNDHGCLPLTEWLEYRFCSDCKASCVNHGHILSYEKVACNL
ncbi:MAG: hypothetical protein WA326_03190 [Nitrososphaeraceae archaeon]